MNEKECLRTFWRENGDKYSERNIEELQKITYIPFIGSGMSVAFGYPVWKNFLADTINRFYEENEKESIDLFKLLNEGKYLEVANKINIILHNPIPEIVRTTFSEKDMAPLKGEDYLSLLQKAGIRTFITTNYDPVIETRLHSIINNIYLPSNLLTSGDVLNSIRQNNGSVIKLHGTYDKADSIILTESDYEKVYCRENVVVREVVNFLWESSVLLFLGCGLTKDYLIELMMELANRKDQNWHYAILEYPNEEYKKFMRYLTQLKIRPIWFEKGKYEQIQLILKMITGGEILEKSDESPAKPTQAVSSVQINTYESTKHSTGKQSKYFDSLADEIKDVTIYKKDLINALFMQCEEYRKNSYTDILTYLYNEITISNSNYPLCIVGEPGTGKSTILSLLYYIFLKKFPKVTSFLFDTHYYDNKVIDNASNDLTKCLNKVSIAISQNEPVVIFVDGINVFARGNHTLEDLIIKYVVEWKKSSNVQFVFSIGILDENLFPPFKHKRANQIQIDLFEKKIYLRPIQNRSGYQQKFVNAIVDWYIDFKKIDISPRQKARIRDKISHYCKKSGGTTTDFRMVYFVLKIFEQSGLSDNFFTTDIGVTFNDYFHTINTEKAMKSIAKYTASSLLEKNYERPPKFYYLYKSEPIRNFFFAYHYIDLLKSANARGLKKYDCIFTPGINRFAVDLMLSEQDGGMKIVQNICDLLNLPSTTENQKNQMAFMLGRVKKKPCKEIAIKVLAREYGNWDWNKMMSTSSAMYIRTVGISLLYLGSILYANTFYDKLISHGFLSRINRNFHIQYFLTNGYRFRNEIKLDDNEMCTVKNIDSLCHFLLQSIRDSTSRKESMCVNTITILNLTVYKIYHLGHSSPKDMNNAKRIIQTLRAQKIGVSNDVVGKYIDNVEQFIYNEDVYFSTIINIYNLKATPRQGWIERKVSLKREVESVADHTWACCQLAMLFLPDKIENCQFISESEILLMKKEFDLTAVLQMLIVHDLAEAYTGDILSKQKSSQHKERENNVIHRLVTLDTLPHFCSFGYIESLIKEFDGLETYNAKLARDIDLIEPLIQLFIYRKDLETYSIDYGIKERDQWESDVSSRLNTSFGRNLLYFLSNHILSRFRDYDVE